MPAPDSSDESCYKRTIFIEVNGKGQEFLPEKKSVISINYFFFIEKHVFVDLGCLIILKIIAVPPVVVLVVVQIVALEREEVPIAVLEALVAVVQYVKQLIKLLVRFEVTPLFLVVTSLILYGSKSIHLWLCVGEQIKFFNVWKVQMVEIKFYNYLRKLQRYKIVYLL